MSTGHRLPPAETGLWTETVTAEYLPGLGLDDHIVAFLHGEEVHFHQDHLGSVLMLTDADGNVLQRYRYDIHGNATVLDANGNVLGGPGFLSPVAAFPRRTGAAPTLGCVACGGILRKSTTFRPADGNPNSEL
ncbi:MAG: hypothetical protein RBU25_17495 [Lentisphaeria bacterium]|nr:hypothetical protein [Lentisphaeria bacterium]